MEFRLLGPVEVVLDDRCFGIAAPRQETVLAMLLLEANRVISVNRLVDAIWDEAPPRTAKSQVQISVSALRRLLTNPCDDEVISTRSPGYVIHAADDSLDLKRFELLAVKGVAAAGEQRLVDATQYLRAALAVWRGPAMAGVESRIVHAAATRLNENRLTVLENCLDLDLQLGRHHEIVGELTELVTEHPLRERLRAQLMLALYRSGQRAEALHVFRVGREILVDELGLDPGDELRRLEAAILASDRSLNLPEETSHTVVRGRADAVPVPRQLPAVAADFTGRNDMIEGVCALLSPVDANAGTHPVPIVALTGQGGVGKTTLAIRAAHLLRDDYPDGQLFAQLHTGDGQPETPDRLLERFLRSFGIPPGMLPNGLDDRAAMYRSWLADRRILIVIDEAISTSQLTPLFPGSSNCAMIVTARNRLPGLEGAYQLEVGALDEQAGMALVARMIGANRARAEETSVRVLVGLCEGLPLALRIATSKLVARPHWRVSQMVHRLQDEKRRLDELDLDGVSIRATLSVSFENLGGDCRRLLLRLSLLGAVDFASWVGAPLLDCDVEPAEDLLEDLVAAQLVEARGKEDGSVRYHLHDLVRIYAIERLVEEESTEGRISPLRRLLGCWLFLTADAHRREYGGDFCVLHGTADLWALPPHTVDALLRDPINWFRNEHPALVAAIFQAAQAGFDELCWDLAMTSVTLFESGSYIDDWRKTHERALTAVRDADNRRGEAAMLYSMGTLALTGCLDDASRDLERSLELFEELGDVHGRALSLGGLAFADRLGGRYDIALERSKAASADFQDAGDLIGEAHMLTEMAKILIDRQQYDAAEQVLNAALTVCQKVGARRVTAQTEYELAELYLRRGHLEKSKESFGAARLTARESGDIVGEAYGLLGLGITHAKQGELAQAEADLQAALDTADRTGDLLIRGRVRLALAELDYVRDRADSALARLEEALSVLSHLGSAAVWRTWTMELVGRLHERAGQTEAARRAWLSALELAGDADSMPSDRLSGALGEIASEASPDLCNAACRGSISPTEVRRTRPAAYPWPPRQRRSRPRWCTGGARRPRSVRARRGRRRLPLRRKT
jgi:DNA-binding SARP family transcriptional activator/tetratricopeptide (TPR) repeat protein